jgi:hypothetical protein
MGTTRQRTRKAARDKKKRWDMIISSVKALVPTEEVLSHTMIMKFIETTHELKLPIASLIGLEALKVRDKQVEIDRLMRSNDALEKQIIHTRGELRQAQETISKMNVRYVRRGSKKAKVQHPEKRR